MPIPGGGSPNLFAMNSFYLFAGGSTSVSAGQTAYFPFYSYGGGPLLTLELYLAASSASQLEWAVLNHASGGGPGSVLASGSVSSPATGWITMPLTSSVTLQSQQFYLFQFTPQGGSITLSSPAISPYVLPTSYSPPSPALVWTGSSWSQLTGNPYRAWAFMYEIGPNWYGQPLTIGNTGSPLYANHVGLSFRLLEPVNLAGCVVAAEAGPGTAVISVYQCDSYFLPSGSPITSVTVFRTAGSVSGSYLFAQFNNPVSVQDFTIVVNKPVSTCVYAYDSGTTDSTRFDRIWSNVRSVKSSDGSSWSVVYDSPSRPVLFVQMIPFISVYGGAGGSVPIVPSLFRGVERC